MAGAVASFDIARSLQTTHLCLDRLRLLQIKQVLMLSIVVFTLNLNYFGLDPFAADVRPKVRQAVQLHNVVIVSIFIFHHLNELFLWQSFVTFGLQDIVHLLVVEGEVAELDIAVEDVRSEWHRWGAVRIFTLIPVLIILRVVSAIYDLLRPNLEILVGHVRI